MALSLEPKATTSSTTRAVVTEFERFEVKFWVTEAVAQRVIEQSAHWLEHDPWCRSGVISRNVSLYLDTRGLLFWENHASASPSRAKLRVRGYGDPPTGHAFFEIKRKVKAVTLKTRARLPVAMVRDVLTGRFDRSQCAPEEQKHLDAFIFLARMHRVEPQVVIAGYREAFVSRTHDDARMTIDRELMYQPTRKNELAFDPRAWRAIPGPTDGRSWVGKPCALIEMKFGGAPPAWMADIIGRFGMQREAYSKYLAAIAHLHGKVP